ncbi:MAG: DUF938 domain-containing protein [Leptolyngbyaceae bacterium]|nr:DUF938 domain-containing protein [Leptolyngbyaceae bacterium]
MTSFDRRQYAPATQRNREPILAVLEEYLPPTGTVLEIASGSGEHALFFAPQLRPRRWLPTDVDPIALDSIAAWQAFAQTSPDFDHLTDCLYPGIALDVMADRWPVEAEPLPDVLQAAGFDRGEIGAIAAMNLIHISPWSACEGLMAGAGRILPPGGVLYLYGPYKREGRHTAPSNAEFDQFLQHRNPAWGVRDLEAVLDLAAQQGLSQRAIVPMPANNLSVILTA